MPILKVRKPKAIFFDMFGTVVKTSFIDKVLFPYIRNNCDTFLANNWGKRVLMRDINLLREQSIDDGGPLIAKSNEPNDKIRRSVVEYILRCQEEVRTNEAIRIFR
ncbi:Enolase-phosphatase E1 [Blomia tropicalis]|nr:Enolase-phosphatase E1 [Blomia tropicalis]